MCHKVECCVYIPDDSQNVSDSLQDLERQVQDMFNSNVPWATVIRERVSKSFWWKSLLLIGIIILLILVFGPASLIL